LAGSALPATKAAASLPHSMALRALSDRRAVAAKDGLRRATRAADVGAPTMMELASLFCVSLPGARSPAVR
jgi:hypothetical protein